MILPIVAYGNDILRETCIPAENTPETQKLIDNMIDTLAQIPTGVGLASVQVNSNLAIFLARLGNNVMVHINPLIRKRRGVQKSMEGCLSIPEINALVPERDDIIDIISYDRNFKEQKFKLRGFDSIIFQHEYHHLNGILFTDLLTKEGKESVKDKLSEIEKGNFKSRYSMIMPPLSTLADSL